MLLGTPRWQEHGNAWTRIRRGCPFPDSYKRGLPTLTARRTHCAPLPARGQYHFEGVRSLHLDALGPSAAGHPWTLAQDREIGSRYAGTPDAVPVPLKRSWCSPPQFCCPRTEQRNLPLKPLQHKPRLQSPPASTMKTTGGIILKQYNYIPLLAIIHHDDRIAGCGLYSFDKN